MGTNNSDHPKKNLEVINDFELNPCVIPAMGSHAGATADEQIQVLADLGITEDAVKAPVVSNMDVVSLGHIESGAEVFFAWTTLLEHRTCPLIPRKR